MPLPISPDPVEVGRVVEHLFRREAGRVIAILTRRFGVEHLPLVEDAVQDALVKAMQGWPLTGVPQNPTAWLLQTARNRAIDHLRRNAVWLSRQNELAPLVDQFAQTETSANTPQFEEEIRDSQLRMMLVCCDPSLSADAQVALILKTLCGFGEREIAAAFLASEAAVIKRLVRARQSLREGKVSLDLPDGEALSLRTESVLQALYLLFNEGYKASHGDALLRADLCGEAIRLAELLVSHAAGQQHSTHALLALMYLIVARLPARLNDVGNVLLLADQDRTRWNQPAIAQGMRHLERSAGGEQITRYHLEAGIAACHALASTFAETNWGQILSLYDQLLELEGSPVVALNRTVCLAQVEGPHAALGALKSIEDIAALKDYHLFHSVAGHLYFQIGEIEEAAACYRRALELAALPPERELLRLRLAQLSTA